jgi:hypothetical protein
MKNMLHAFRSTRPRAPRVDLGLRSLLAVLLLVVATPAFAAKVKEVRVGRHPEFTRVVFELDEQTGYRIVRKERELIITLDAASTPYSIGKRGSIQSVKVEGGTDTSVARIRLRQSGLRLQEMILANPPRIVLDLMHDAPVAPPTVKPPKPAPKPAVVKPAPEKKPAPVAVAPKPAVVKPALEKKPAPVAVAPKPAPTAAPSKPAPDPEPTNAKAEPKKDLYAPQDPDDQVDEPRSFVKAKPAAVSRKDTVDSTKPASASAKPSPLTARLVDPMVIAAAAVALVFIAALVVMLRRRRSIPNDVDMTAFAGEDDDDDAAFASSDRLTGESASGAEPHAASDDDDLFGDLGSDSFTSSPSVGGESTAKSESSMFDDDPTTSASTNQGDSLMSQQTSDMQSTVDITRIVQELQSRMGALETKLEEANEARDRLERQMAAQSEELRVQRAAIARTQRALRSMSRGDEDTATEPALKGADTQMKTRING